MKKSFKTAIAIAILAVLAGSALTTYYLTDTSVNSGSFAKLDSLDHAVASELQRNIMGDTHISGDRNAVLDAAANRFMELGMYGKVSVLDPASNTYVQQALTHPMIQALGNASVAEQGATPQGTALPHLSRAACFALGNATGENPQIADFSTIIVSGANQTSSDLYKDSGRIAVGCYSLAQVLEQCPYMLGQPQSFEFVNGLHRQHNSVLDKVGLDPTNASVLSAYVTPDFDYYFKVLANKTITVDGQTMTFPLLPLMDGAKMKEQFPSSVDRQVIYASQYPIQLAYHDCKTGEDHPWPNIYQAQTLKNNLELVWSGGDFGTFHGTVFDRVTKAYTDHTLNSNVNSSDSDYQRAISSYNQYKELPDDTAINTGPAISAFANGVDGKLAANLKTDLGNRFVYGLALADEFTAHQLAVDRASLYAKALGTSAMCISAGCPSVSYVHERSAGPVPQYLADQLPAARYGPGKNLSVFSLADSSLELIADLPNGDTVKI